jgi:hypothetical protein
MYKMRMVLKVQYTPVYDVCIDGLFYERYSVPYGAITYVSRA